MVTGAVTPGMRRMLWMAAGMVLARGTVLVALHNDTARSSTCSKPHRAQCRRGCQLERNMAWKRRTDMRPLVIVLALLMAAAGCSQQQPDLGCASP